MHSSEKPSKSWTNSSRVCRNTHRRHFENGSRRHQRDRGFWCFHSVAIFDSTYSVPLLSTFQQENLRVLTSVKDFETWKSCTLDLGPFKEVLGHSDRSQEVRRKPSGVSKRLRYVSKFLDVARWVWCCESLVGENTRKNINVEGSFPFFSLSCGSMQH